MSCLNATTAPTRGTSARSTYAANDDEARWLAIERWLQTEPELRLQIVRVNGDRPVRVEPRKE
jgi:hypothetical protein